MCECVRISIKLYQYYDIICPLTNNLWHYKFSHVRLFAILQARILEWVAFPFSRGSSQPRDRIQVSRIAGGFFTSWTTRKAHGGWDSKESAWSVGDLGSIPVSGRSSGEGNGNPLQYSGLENPMDMGSQRVGHNWATSLSFSVQVTTTTQACKCTVWHAMHCVLLFPSSNFWLELQRESQSFIFWTPVVTDTSSTADFLILLCFVVYISGKLLECG